MVMEFIDGESLAEIIRNRINVPIADKLSYLEQICAGLHFAHRCGIIHRDIKPANVMVDKEGMVRILDFGIARIEGSVMTQGGALIGSVNYMSPEQMLGRQIDHRSDIFSVGSLAYELISYQQAFKGGLNDGLLQRLPNEHPPSLSELCPGLPAGLEGVIVRALQKAPEDRFEDLAEMREALLDILQRVESPGEQNTVMILREALQASLGTPAPATLVQSEPAPHPALPADSHQASPDNMLQLPDHQVDALFPAAQPAVMPSAEPPTVFQPAPPPTPVPQTWQVKQKTETPGRVVARQASSSPPTSRPPSTMTAKPVSTRTSRPPTPLPSSGGSRRWVAVFVGLAALVVAAAAAIPYFNRTPVDPLDEARPAIEAAMERFRIAYRNRDLNAVRAAFPALPQETQRGLQRTFTDCLVYDVIVDQMAIELTLTNVGVADVHSTHTCTQKTGGRETTSTRHDVYTLRRDGKSWVIDGVATPAGAPGERRR
jgi:serine/threonine protein kinase